MAGTIRLEVNEWRLIRERIWQDYPPSYTLMSSVTRRELGFTVRNHKEYADSEDELIYDQHGNWSPYRTVICLDFYDDVKETYFRVKYL